MKFLRKSILKLIYKSTFISLIFLPSCNGWMSDVESYETVERTEKKTILHSW
jgi:hypothetical protein